MAKPSRLRRPVSTSCPSTRRDRLPAVIEESDRRDTWDDPLPDWDRQILDDRLNDPEADFNDRERLIREQAAIDPRLRRAAIVDSSGEALSGEGS